jgi:hypothetical protein
MDIEAQQNEGAHPRTYCREQKKKPELHQAATATQHGLSDTSKMGTFKSP